MVLIFLFVLSLSLLIVRKQDLYSPWSITILVWLVESFLFISLDHGLYNTTGYFEIGLFLWICSFCGVSYITSHLLIKKTIIRPRPSFYNKQNFKCLFTLSIIFVPISAYLTYKYATSGGWSENLFFNLRYASTQDPQDKGPLKYISYVALIPLYAECNLPHINKIRITILYILNVVIALMTMAKTTLFVVFIGSALILLWNNKIKAKILLIGFLFFFFITIIFATLRSYSLDTDINITKTLSVYTLSPIVAFDRDAAKTQDFTYSGEKTLRFFYKVAQGAGANVKVDDTIQPFIDVPYSTNVYTIFYQYFKDFGYFGIIFFGVINGLIYGWIYSKINSSPACRLLYAYCAVSLLLQFFNEIFWVTVSIVIQLIILSFFIYFKYEKR